MMRVMLFASLAISAMSLGGLDLPSPPTGGALPLVGELTMSGATNSVGIDGPNVQNSPGTRRYQGVPDVLVDGEAIFISSGSATHPMVLKCNSDELSCLFFVVLTRCSPCSVDFNGGLPGQLLESGFESASCGPKYIYDGVARPTTIFRKMLGPGESVSFELTKDLEHAAVFHIAANTECSALQPVICTSSAMCAWDGHCGLTPLCPVKPHGPFEGGESHCACPM